MYAIRSYYGLGVLIILLNSGVGRAIDISSLHFYSDEEKALFEAHSAGQPDYFSLLYNAYYRHTGNAALSKEGFYRRLSPYREAKNQQLKPARLVKQLYSDMEQAYLHKYSYNFV